MKIYSWIEKNLPKNSTILEAGAADGTDTLNLSSRCPDGNVYAFEPCSRLYKKCKDRTSKIKNVKLFNKALGTKNETVELNLLGNNNGFTASSLLKPTNELFAFHKKLSKHGTENVEKINLDNFLLSNKIKRINLAWLDLQGYEPFIFNNCNYFRSICEFIYTEVSLINTYKNAITYPEFKSILEKNNYELILEDIYWEDMGNVLFKNKNI